VLKAKKTTREDTPQMQEALEQVTREVTKRLNVEIPASLLQEIKILAARQNVHIKDIIVECLQEYIAKHSNPH
jgi:nitrate/nitrite-specific signal transduction histidine kinase